MSVDDTSTQSPRDISLKRCLMLQEAWRELERFILPLDLEACLRQAVQELADFFQAPTAAVILRDGEMVQIEAQLAGQPCGAYGAVVVQGTVAERVSHTGQPLLFENRGQLPEGLAALEAESQSIVAVPLWLDDTLLGALALESPEPQAFDVAKQELLLAWGHQVALAIHNARLYQAERRRAEQLAVLVSITQAICPTSLQPEQVYRKVYEHLSRVIPCDAFIISLFDPQTRLIRAAFSVQDGVEHDVSHYPPLPLQPPGQGTQSEVIRTGRSLIVANLGAQLKGHAVYRFGTPGPSTRSAIYVPLCGEGQIMGVLQVQSYAVAAYRAEDIPFLEAVASQVAAALVRTRLYQTLQRLEIPSGR